MVNFQYFWLRKSDISHNTMHSAHCKSFQQFLLGLLVYLVLNASCNMAAAFMRPMARLTYAGKMMGGRLSNAQKLDHVQWTLWRCLLHHGYTVILNESYWYIRRPPSKKEREVAKHITKWGGTSVDVMGLSRECDVPWCVMMCHDVSQSYIATYIATMDI